ncbi:hypothetical protein B2J88_44260 [Rhodococcus sp. SRB_17]|nr:hypothetical protein [Rhodococcus sp. SRB_17]
MEMSSKRKAEGEKTSDTRPRKISHKDLAMYSGAGASLLGGDSPETAVGNGIAARGYAGATNASYDYHVNWSKKVAATHGFWRKLKVIVIG